MHMKPVSFRCSNSPSHFNIFIIESLACNVKFFDMGPVQILGYPLLVFLYLEYVYQNSPKKTHIILDPRVFGGLSMIFISQLRG